MSKTKTTDAMADLLEARADRDQMRGDQEAAATAQAQARLGETDLNSHAREILRTRIEHATAEAARRQALAAAGRAGAAALRGKTGRA